MDFNTLPSPEIEIDESMDKVLKTHFENIEKGNFDSINFCSGTSFLPLLSLEKIRFASYSNK